ncbi:MAG: aldehyde dehydrogenase family protein [Schleiferiaceae bacterium]|nr:aldehyde dehydrogenase family protein [Schleiferiaceae bacterium]
MKLSMNPYQDILNKQRAFFKTGVTREKKFRRRALDLLLKAIVKYEKEIEAALWQDLRKSPFEVLATEVGFSKKEIKELAKNLNRWTAPEYVGVPLLISGPGSGKIVTEPLGTSLIIGPWNYPFQLVIAPLAGAIAAGNTVVLKPSEVSSATEQVINKMISEYFEEEYIAVVVGGVQVSQDLLALPWDHIFFTGSTAVGKVVMKAAAEHLSAVTLELGGKSPTVVDASANIKLAAKRIAWGKFLNAGQTCIAPDYILVEKKVKSELISELNHWIGVFFGNDAALSADYGRIVSDRHFDRLSRMLSDKERSAINPEDKFIPPTLLELETPEHPSMEEEIFGPILPILTVDNVDEALAFIQERPKPLALYVFTSKNRKRFERETTSGGLFINDVILHVGNPELPFGGVGPSGFGSYHGKYSVDCFSHKKAVQAGVTWLDVPFRYPPYKNWVYKLLQRIF